MEVKNCKNCGRLYNYIGGVYRLCPECMRKLEEKFQEVKDYIEDNPRADMREISEKCDVSTRQIEQWIEKKDYRSVMIHLLVLHAKYAELP